MLKALPSSWRLSAALLHAFTLSVGETIQAMRSIWPL